MCGQRFVPAQGDHLRCDLFGRSLNLGSAVLGVEGESRQRVVYATLNSLGQHNRPQAQTQEEVMP